MAQDRPQIFRDEEGRRILFGLRFEADEAERERVKDLIESHGGRVVGYSALPKTGYLLVDTETDEGRQLSAARHAPPQRYVVHNAWPELCINSGRILPPLLHPPVFVLDGKPVKIHLHKSLSHDTAEALHDLIQDYGGDTDIEPDEANVIIASQKHVSYRTLLKRYKSAVQTPPWIFRMIKRGEPLVAGPPEAPQPPAPALPPALPLPLAVEGERERGKEPDFEDLFPHQPLSKERVRFTPAEDIHFIKYLANLDVLIAGALSGNTLYQHMRDTQPWARRHTWHSWRQRYLKNKATFIALICKQARRNYAALPPPKKREVQERYKIRKEMDKARARRRREQIERDEFGLNQIIDLPGDAPEEAEDMYDLWAQQLPRDEDEPMRPREARGRRVVEEEEEVHGLEEEEEEEEVAALEEPQVQDNDADFLEGYVGEMNTIDYSQAVAANEVEDAAAPVRLPSPVAPPPPRRATRAGSKAPQPMPPPAKLASRAVPVPPPAGPSRATAQPVAGPSRLPARFPVGAPRAPASRRDSMAEVEHALVTDTDSDTNKGKGKRKGKRGHVSSDDEDAQLLLKHHAILTSLNIPKVSKQEPQDAKPTKKKRAAPEPERTFSPRKLRARPASTAPGRRAASVRVAPALVPIVRAGSSTSEADGAFKPPRNTRARAVREAQTPFTPLPNTRAAQVTNSRGSAV